MLQERLAAVLEEGLRVLATLELRFIELRGLVLGCRVVGSEFGG